jgi:hypothetical protein
VIGEQAPSLPEPTLLPPASFQELASTVLEPPSMRVTRDHATGTVSVRMGSESVTLLEGDATARTRRVSTTTVSPDDPARASVLAESEVELRTPDRTVVSTAFAEMDSDMDTFHVSIRLAVTMDGAPVREREWRRSIPRQLL